MLYIKVKPEYNNTYYSDDFEFFVGNELYTINEFNKIKKRFNDKFLKKYDINDIFEYKIISKKKTYFFFGARFANE